MFFLGMKTIPTKTGTIFQNDSYEWETKLRYQTTHFIDQWKWAAGFNLQKSSYKNNTVFNYYDISYNTTLNFAKYGFFVKVHENYSMTE